MKTMDRFDELLDPWARGELTPAELAEFEAILSAYPELRAEAGDHRTFLKIIAAEKPVKAPAGLVQAALAKARAEQKTAVVEVVPAREETAQVRPLGRIWYYAAAAAVLVMAGGYAVLRPGGDMAAGSGGTGNVVAMGDRAKDEKSLNETLAKPDLAFAPEEEPGAADAKGTGAPADMLHYFEDRSGFIKATADSQADIIVGGVKVVRAHDSAGTPVESLPDARFDLAQIAVGEEFEAAAREGVYFDAETPVELAMQRDEAKPAVLFDSDEERKARDGFDTAFFAQVTPAAEAPAPLGISVEDLMDSDFAYVAEQPTRSEPEAAGQKLARASVPASAATSEANEAGSPQKVRTRDRYVADVVEKKESPVVAMVVQTTPAPASVRRLAEADALPVRPGIESTEFEFLRRQADRSGGSVILPAQSDTLAVNFPDAESMQTFLLMLKAVPMEVAEARTSTGQASSVSSFRSASSRRPETSFTDGGRMFGISRKNAAGSGGSSGDLKMLDLDSFTTESVESRESDRVLLLIRKKPDAGSSATRRVPARANSRE